MKKRNKKILNKIIIVVIALVVTAITFYSIGKKKRNKVEESIETINIKTIDSIWTSKMNQLDSMISNSNNMLIQIKNKQDELSKEYTNINSVRYINDDDSLLRSIISSTSRELFEVEISE